MPRTGSPSRIYIAPAMLLLVMSCLGCAKSSTANETSHSGQLIEAEQSAFAPLQEELALLEQAGETPAAGSEQLQAKLAGKPSFLVEINRIFRGVDTARVAEIAAGMYATSRRLTPLEAQAIRELRVKFASERNAVDELLNTNPPLGFFPALAFGGDFAFVDACAAAHALYLFEAAENCVAGRPAEALPPLAQMFTLARKLEESPVATTRLQSAQLRRQALRLVAVMVEHPRADGPVIQALAALLQLQLNRWCDDTELIRGERLMGLIVYERVRRGEFANLLANEEYERLKREQLFAVTRKSVRKQIDLDETFYLQAMRELHEAARRPYFERAALLTNLRERLTELGVSPEYPYVAGNFLLHDFEQVQFTLASDLARTQAWWLALQAAVNSGIPNPIPLNPVTGLPFELAQEADRWLVRGIEGEVITVPRSERP